MLIIVMVSVVEGNFTNSNYKTKIAAKKKNS